MKTIGISIGDPAGIGPELVLHHSHTIAVQGAFPVLFGSRELCEKVSVDPSYPMIDTSSHKPTDEAAILNVKTQIEQAKSEGAPGLFVHVADLPSTLKWGIGTAQSGQLSLQYLEWAMCLAEIQILDALVTAPISKAAWSAAGCREPGHTTLLAKHAGVDKVGMAFFAEPFALVLATAHLPLADVSEAITADCLRLAAENAVVFARMLGLNKPRIAMAGLNPHAGEAGLLGKEEVQCICPFLKTWNKENPRIDGPISPDTLFYRAKQGDYDLLIALYHDQGLIALKTLAFDDAVNVTVGLPYIRTSPDHGTAFDLAYKGQANPASMKAAMRLACTLNTGHAA